MTSSRPYLIRALHEWVLDNDMTPYLLVDATQEGVDVPRQSVQDGKIILNISPQAVQGLVLSNDRVEFNARFGGVSSYISVPVAAVLAIYARENGRGMVFAEEEGDGGPPEGPDDEPPKRPSLKVVK
jgi:stringent starvation protein B